MHYAVSLDLSYCFAVESWLMERFLRHHDKLILLLARTGIYLYLLSSEYVTPILDNLYAQSRRCVLHIQGNVCCIFKAM